MILALLFACYSPEEFQVDLDEAVCEYALACFAEPETTVGDYGYCLQPDREPAPFEGADRCDFDSKAARDCVKDVDKMSCPDEDRVVLPISCLDVWHCF